MEGLRWLVGLGVSVGLEGGREGVGVAGGFTRDEEGDFGWCSAKISAI